MSNQFQKTSNASFNFLCDLYELMCVKYGYPIDDIAKMLEGLTDNAVGSEVDFFKGVINAIWGDENSMSDEAQGVVCGTLLLQKFNETQEEL